MALFVTFVSSAELNCWKAVFPVCGPDNELLKGSSRPVTVPTFSEGLNVNDVELVVESRKRFLAFTFSDELNSEHMVDGIPFDSGELRTDPTRLSVPFPCIVELNRQEGDDCTCCNEMELISEYRWLCVGFTSCVELDCEDSDDSIRCIDDKLDEESIRGT